MGADAVPVEQEQQVLVLSVQGCRVMVVSDEAGWPSLAYATTAIGVWPHLDHVYSVVALNLIRLNAWWNSHPLDRTRIGHLARLELSLAA